MNYLGQLSHPNLVKLIGYCSEDEQRLLVYEFMTRGSLENHLFRSMFFYFILVKLVHLLIYIIYFNCFYLAQLHCTHCFKMANVLYTIEKYKKQPFIRNVPTPNFNTRTVMFDRKHPLPATFLEPTNEGCTWSCKGACFSSQ